MWDVRARAAVYELATGNNAVTSLAWDAKHHCLYAATECSYKDRLGFRHDYRPAMIPRRGRRGHDDEDDYRCWPEQAWHSEDYFEYAFDAGDHRICESPQAMRNRLIPNPSCSQIVTCSRRIPILPRYLNTVMLERASLKTFGKLCVCTCLCGSVSFKCTVTASMYAWCLNLK